jgi:hypothetical protein
MAYNHGIALTRNRVVDGPPGEKGGASSVLDAMARTSKANEMIERYLISHGLPSGYEAAEITTENASAGKQPSALPSFPLKNRR